MPCRFAAWAVHKARRQDQDYRVMTEALFDRLTLDKVVIENSERDWPRYDQQVLERLGWECVPSAS